MIVNLHIEHLVIDGLPVGSHEAPLVRIALSAELGRLIADGGLARGLAHRQFDPFVRTDPIAQPSRHAGRLGEQIGQAVHGVIGR